MSEATASSGGRLGRYHLVEPIGGGANGEVHRAKVYGVAGFERQFAVKKFFPHVALDAKFAQALSAAARGYGSLEHPRIARLAEFGVSGGHTFTATELVPGLDAARLLFETLGSGGSIPPGSALALVSQAARAVGYAHGRGISHLGVAPTNFIISVDGEVKLTDIGILGACLPERPAHDGRFVTRIHYLAPEQINGEPSSAATDVFALGLIAYELVTGERPFTGPTPEDVAQAILTGQPREPQLPRPIMRVLQRCLARSPYERFPDARALADALDAALRVSPVPGTRAEIAELVQVAMARIAALHEQSLSGVLSLNLPTAGGGLGIPESHEGVDGTTRPFSRLEPTAGGPSPSPSPNPNVTLQGMSPPQIPSIPPPPRFGPPPTSNVPTGTLSGASGPTRPPRAITGGTPPPIPAVRRTQNVPVIRPDTELTPPPQMPPPIAGPGSSGRIPPIPRPAADPGRFATSDPTREVGFDRMATVERIPTEDATPIPMPMRMDTGEPVRPDLRRETTGEPVDDPRLAMGSPSDGITNLSTEAVKKELDNNRGMKIAIVVAALAVVLAGSLIGWQMLQEDDDVVTAGKPIEGSGAGIDAAAIAATAPDAAAVAAVAADGATAVIAPATADAAAIAAAAPDAAAVIAAAAPDAAAVAAAPVDAGAAVIASPDTNLILESRPPGARVFLDGADQGLTPISLPGSADRHNVALVLAGYAPYIAELDGKGKFTIDLEEVVPSGGPAGIKVKCRSKERYYVWVDGKPTGQLCPTERIEVVMGEHHVEVYDLVTETRRQFKINVKETRLSFRIRVD